MHSDDNFYLYLELLRGAKPKPHDLAGDPVGELVWRRVAETIADEQPFNRHPPDDGLVEAEIAAFDRFWQCQFLGTGLSCTQARDIGAPSAENIDFLSSRRTSPLVFPRL